MTLEPLAPGAGYHGRPSGGPHGLAHAGMDGEDIDQAGQVEDAPYLPARRGEQQVTAVLPGLHPDPAQRGQGAAVDELERGQIDDDPRVARCGRGEHSHDIRGIGDVKLSVQRNDEVTDVFAGAQVGGDHGGAFLLWQQGKVRARRLSQLPIPILRPVPGSGGSPILPAPGAACVRGRNAGAGRQTGLMFDKRTLIWEYPLAGSPVGTGRLVEVTELAAPRIAHPPEPGHQIWPG
jgi:hypothetical protein